MHMYWMRENWGVGQISSVTSEPQCSHTTELFQELNWDTVIFIKSFGQVVISSFLEYKRSRILAIQESVSSLDLLYHKIIKCQYL